ncbi:uncharacterized protein LOC110068769 [Orbicella faveolata]|uniref:uncharacterized protein LOC110068769 n=1 Tax=Orbicella faveolata TaxID=48498 RepID=UPI0009E40C7E|nr:uncharacterized protein LOC110068769 [Orbicella faveolata]
MSLEGALENSGSTDQATTLKVRLFHRNVLVVSGNFIDVYAAGGGLEGPSSVSFADLRTLYAASYDSDRIVLYNSTTGLSYTFPGKRNEHPGDGSFRNVTLDR